MGSDLCYREKRFEGGGTQNWSDLDLCLVVVFAFGFSGFAGDGLLGLCLYYCWSLVLLEC